MTTEQKIFSTALQDGMPELLSRFIVAQAKHETGNFTHKFFTIGNNAFGYEYVSGSKWQLDKGGTNADNGIPIAQYAIVENSVHELTDWIKRRQHEGKFPSNLANIQNSDDYAFLLRNAGYYTAPYTTYADRLAYWLNQLPALSVPTPSSILLLAIAVLIIIFHKES